MSNQPAVQPLKWLDVYGEGSRDPVDVVVCAGPSEWPSMEHIEVVRLDYRDRAINTYARWTGTRWEFDTVGQDGYADRYDRLREHVSILRQGRYRR